MSKIAEKKVMELGYRTDPLARYEYSANDVFEAAVECYDQAMQDMVKDSEHLQYLSDEMGYVYACGCRRTMQDFMEKAEEFLYLQLNNGSIECGNIERLIEDFKNYMQDEM